MAELMSDKSKASGDNIMLMVGTMKGAFLATGSEGARIPAELS